MVIRKRLFQFWGENNKKEKSEETYTLPKPFQNIKLINSQVVEPQIGTDSQGREWFPNFYATFKSNTSDRSNINRTLWCKLQRETPLIFSRLM